MKELVRTAGTGAACALMIVMTSVAPLHGQEAAPTPTASVPGVERVIDLLRAWPGK